MEIIGIVDLMSAIEKATFKYEISNCDEGCCPEYVYLIDSALLIEELKKSASSNKTTGVETFSACD